MEIIAVIFDYDDTIVPDSTTKLLKYYEMDPKKFWEVDFKKLCNQGYNPTNAHLKLILDNIGHDKPLGILTNRKLREFGSKLAEQLQYGELDSLVEDLNNYVKIQRENSLDVEIEFYVISGGLEEIIMGNRYIREYAKDIYGCALIGEKDNPDEELKHIKRTITFTEKTKYLFEINKGITKEESFKDPSAVTKPMPHNKRRIPFCHMIYIGDGLTDVPCFSLIQSQGGIAIKLSDEHIKESLKLKVLKEVLPEQKDKLCAPQIYGKKDKFGELIRAAVGNICANISFKKKII